MSRDITAAPPQERSKSSIPWSEVVCDGTLCIIITNVTSTAELVRTMKSNSGHTLRELARRAKTSAPALVDYEAGRHEPKLSTLQRIAEAAGCDLIVEVRPRLTHPERRTLELYKLVAEKLRADPLK